MEKIAERMFIEKEYPGVVSSALLLKQGVLLIDAPFRVDDRQSWLERITELGGINNRLMVMLDGHADRLSSTQLMECPILTHKNALRVIPGLLSIQDQPGTTERQKNDAAESFQNIRWAIPDLTYSGEIAIQWDANPVVISHHPGVHPAASWVQYDAGKVVFVGDSVVIKQPPFLDCCNLKLWINELELLSSDVYRGYKIVGGRNGVIEQDSIIEMQKFLTSVNDTIYEFSAVENCELALAERVNTLMKSLNYECSLENYYKNRLTRGLKQLLVRYKKGELEIEGENDVVC